MSQSFSYEDLVLSSRFERVMNQANNATAINHSHTHTTPITETIDFNLTSPPTRSRAQTTNSHSRASNNHQNHHHSSSNRHSSSSSGHSSIIASHPAVQSRLKLFWLTLNHQHVLVNNTSNNHSSNTHSEVRHEVCVYDEFYSFYCKLTRVLLSPHYHHSLTQANCESDWLTISQIQNSSNNNSSTNNNNRILTQTKFINFLFDIVTLYVHLTDIAQFVFTLNKIYTIMTKSLEQSVIYQPLNEILIKDFNLYLVNVNECQLYVHSICDRYERKLFNDGIDFSMPLLPAMKIEIIDEIKIFSAMKTIKLFGQSFYGVRQGPNREGLAFSIASMPPGYDSLAEIGGIGALPATWSPTSAMNRLKISQFSSMINIRDDTDDEEELFDNQRNNNNDWNSKRRRSVYELNERKEENFHHHHNNKDNDSNWNNQPFIAPIRERARSTVAAHSTSSMGSPIIVISNQSSQARSRQIWTPSR